MALVDPWTLGHAAWGLFFAWRRARFWTVVALAFAWEWFENSVLHEVGWGETDPFNSLVDVVVAVAACGVGVGLRSFVRHRRLGAVLDDVERWGGRDG